MTNDKTNSYIPFNDAINDSKVYYVVDQGIFPFKVVVNDDGITIYKEDDSNDYRKVVYQLKRFTGYWFGYDPTSSKKGEKHGNTILIHTFQKRYVFVGRHILSFRAKEKIVDYISFKNDFPRAVAYSKNYAYFPLECESVIPLKEFDLAANVANADKIYSQIRKHGEKSLNFEDPKMIHYRLD